MLIGSRGSTNVENVFIITLLLFTIGIFSYFISSISFILSEINKNKAIYNKNL
jgi:hypothetical protein